ncbi:hypothetical protein QUB69_16905 [Microcoleus sp. AT13-A6]
MFKNFKELKFEITISKSKVRRYDNLGYSQLYISDAPYRIINRMNSRDLVSCD